MRARTFLRRVKRMSGGERAALGEAVAMLVAASLAIRLMPFRALAKRLERYRGTAAAGADVERARWAVRAAAPFLPWRTLCFEQGLALHLMLRRRGVPSRLHYGVGRGEKDLSAHVWVSLGGEIIAGEEEAARHACLVTFPGGEER